MSQLIRLPWAVDGGDDNTRLSAETARYAVGSLLEDDGGPAGSAVSKRGGVHPSGSSTMQVTAVSAAGSAKVNVAPGQCSIWPARSARGPYLGATLDVTAAIDILGPDGRPADAQPRIDVVVVRVLDSAYDSSGQTQCVIDVIRGAPDVAPQFPDLPDACLELAQITVPAGAKVIRPADILDQRFFTAALGGRIFCLGDEYYPKKPYPGQEVFDRRLNYPLYFTGTRWSPLIGMQRVFQRSTATSSTDAYSANGFRSMIAGSWTAAPAGNYLLTATFAGYPSPATATCAAQLRVQAGPNNVSSDMPIDYSNGRKTDTFAGGFSWSGGDMSLLMAVQVQSPAVSGVVMNAPTQLTATYVGPS